MLELLQYREVRELSLSANQLKSAVSRRKFRAGHALNGSTVSIVEGTQDDTEAPIHCTRDCANGELLVTLKPMQVRTFELIYRPEELDLDPTA